jgi:glycosyltransferase involved in cell wall biosynthesis
MPFDRHHVDDAAVHKEQDNTEFSEQGDCDDTERDVIAEPSQMRDHDDVLGVLIGGPWGAASSYFEQVKEYARKLAGDRILFTGTMSHENVRRSWHDFDCAIHVPLSENCGGVVEPLAAGVPTIAGRVGGLPEVVVDSKSGLVVPIRNPRVLADAVEQVLQYPDYFRDLAQNGRALVTNMFEVSRTAEEIAGIYRHLVEGAPRPAEYNSVAELQRIALAKPPLPASSIPPPMLPRSLDSLRTASFDGNTKVVFVATASQSLKFHKAQAIRMRELGWEVDIISASGPELAEFASKGFHTTAIEMHREIAPLEDARCLAQFYRALKASKPQMVIAATPKASLLCVLAARAAGVPRIVFSLFGMRSETLKGWKAIVVRGLERLTARCADITIACSRSLQERAITSGIVDPSATVVLGSGGPSGIDVREFQVCAEHTLQACELRQQYGLHPDDFVIGFVGRLVRDKGIVELAEAFEQICHNRQGVKLVLVGGPEPTDPVPERTLRLLNQNPNVVQVAFTNDVRPWYAAFDAFVLPTYREGLPTVVLEAQAAGIPVVVTRATGTLDAVVEGTTAIVAEARDAESLRRNIELILDDPQGAARRVEAGREFVQREFDEQVVTWHYVNFYQHLARQKPTPASLPSVN